MKKLIITIALILAIKSITFAQSNFPFEVKITGKGSQPVIFVPGFACSGEVFNETSKIFESNFTCYILTMPGFAGVKPEAEPDFKGWIKSLAEYISENNIEQPVVIGHSMGGGMALWLASEYPDLISKIVVVDALPFFNALLDASFKANEKADCSEFVNNYKNMSNEQLYQMQKMMMTQLLADTSMTETVIQWSLKSDRNTLGQIFCQYVNTDLRDMLDSIKCPSLILLESNFKAISPAIEKQYAKLKGGQLEYSTKGLHFIMFDDKEWYFEQLKKFVK